MKNIKKIAAGIFAGLTITAACACTTATADNFHNLENYYPATFIITEIAWEPGSDSIQIITGEDCMGNQWTWYSDAGDWTVGDLVACIMYDMETECIYDDIIIDADYVGIPEWYTDPASRPTGELPTEPEAPMEPADLPEPPAAPTIPDITEIVYEDGTESAAPMVVGKCEVKIPAILGDYLA